MDTVSAAKQRSVSLTKRELVDAHARLMQSRPLRGGARYVSLARFGFYDVRLFETPGKASEDVAQVWIELYAHDRRYSLGGCGCRDAEHAAVKANELIRHATHFHARVRPHRTPGTERFNQSAPRSRAG